MQYFPNCMQLHVIIAELEGLVKKGSALKGVVGIEPFENKHK